MPLLSSLAVIRVVFYVLRVSFLGASWLGQFERMKAPTEVVKVDEQVPGCPMLETGFVQVVEKYIAQMEVG